MMRKNKFAVFTLLGTILMILSSCDPWWGLGGRPSNPDSDRGYLLSGKWFGDLNMVIDGEPARGSVLEFIPEDYAYSYGWGTEVDYYGWNGTSTLVNHFEWEIIDRCIYMYFQDPSLNCRIWDYMLSPSFFQGSIDNYGYTSRFKLWNYDRYWGDFGYGRPYSVEELKTYAAPADSRQSAGHPVCKRVLGNKI